MNKVEDMVKLFYSQNQSGFSGALTIAIVQSVATDNYTKEFIIEDLERLKVKVKEDSRLKYDIYIYESALNILNIADKKDDIIKFCDQIKK